MRGFICAAIVGMLLLYSAPLLRSQTAQPNASSAMTKVPGEITPPAPGAPSQQVVAVTTVPSPAAPTNPFDQFVWAGVASYVLRYLTKKEWFPVLTPASTSRFKAQLGFLVALMTAAGVHMAVNGSFFSEQGVGFTMTGLSAHAVKDVGFQWLSQQAWYDTIVKKVIA